MATAEINLPVHSTHIEGFTHSDIQGHIVTPKFSPFRDGHIAIFSCVGIEPPSNNGHKPESNLILTSSHHGRAYEFRVGEETTIIWADEYGNIFTKLNTKGNNCSSPKVYRSGNAPSGFLLYGMQDSNATVRVLKASELLRSHNIDTEAIIKLIEPAELPVGEEMLPLPEFKKRLVKQIWEEDAGENDMYGGHFLKVTRKQVPQLSTALDKMTLFISVRGLQVSERLADLAKATNRGELLQMVGNAFRFVNIDEEVKAKRDKNYTPEHFSVDKKEDIFRYFMEYLPRRIARNLAGMHRFGLVHFYPHSANISTVGSFYDLDSVRGEPLGLGDNPVRHEDLLKDVEDFLNGNNGFLKPVLIVSGVFNHCEIPGDAYEFRNQFLKYYVQEMGWVGDVSRFGDIYQLFNEFILVGQEGLLDYYVEEVAKRLNLNLGIDTAQITEFVARVLPAQAEVGDKDVLDKIVESFVARINSELSLKIIAQCTDAQPDADFEERHSFTTFSKVFIEKTINKLSETIKTSIKTQNPDLDELLLTLTSNRIIGEYQNDLYQNLIKQWGWEQDIAANADAIDYCFGQFDLLPAYLEYYLTRLSEQIGWDFVMEETVEEMIAKFHEADQHAARAAIEHGLANAVSKDDLAKIIDDALEDDKFDLDYLHDDRARYVGFICHYIDERFNKMHRPQIEQLAEKYGDDNADAIAYWFKHRYENKFVNQLPDEIAEPEIEKKTAERINNLKQEYLTSTV